MRINFSILNQINFINSKNFYYIKWKNQKQGYFLIKFIRIFRNLYLVLGNLKQSIKQYMYIKYLRKIK